MSKLTHQNSMQQNRSDVVLAKVDAMLAAIPEMAAGDRQRRVSHDTYEAEHAAEERACEANWARVMARDVQMIRLPD